MAESVSALTTRLASIDTAIAATEAAQSAGSRGTNITRASLDVLYRERARVQRQLESAQAHAAGRSRMFSRTRITGIGGH